MDSGSRSRRAAGVTAEPDGALGRLARAANIPGLPADRGRPLRTTRMDAISRQFAVDRQQPDFRSADAAQRIA